jgi:1-acyl-sn-glycerol-3-phosphate acyltransferase
MMSTRNNRANYYIYDVIDPADFSDKAAYAEYVHGKYLQWQARYLD